MRSFNCFPPSLIAGGGERLFSLECTVYLIWVEKQRQGSNAKNEDSFFKAAILRTVLRRWAPLNSVRSISKWMYLNSAPTNTNFWRGHSCDHQRTQMKEFPLKSVQIPQEFSERHPVVQGSPKSSCSLCQSAGGRGPLAFISCGCKSTCRYTTQLYWGGG